MLVISKILRITVEPLNTGLLQCVLVIEGSSGVFTIRTQKCPEYEGVFL